MGRQIRGQAGHRRCFQQSHFDAKQVCGREGTDVVNLVKETEAPKVQSLAGGVSAQLWPQGPCSARLQEPL